MVYLTNGYGDLNIGYRIANGFGVRIGQSIFSYAFLTAGVGFPFRRLDRFNNQIRAAKLCYGILCFSAGAFADGQHSDDRTNAEDYTQCCQGRTQPMHP